VHPNVSVGDKEALREEWRSGDMMDRGNSGLSLFVLEGHGGNLSTNLERDHEQDHEQSRTVLRLDHTMPSNPTIYEVP